MRREFMRLFLPSAKACSISMQRLVYCLKEKRKILFSSVPLSRDYLFVVVGFIFESVYAKEDNKVTTFLTNYPV